VRCLAGSLGGGVGMVLGVAGAPTNSLILAGWSAIIWTGAGIAGGSLSAQVAASVCARASAAAPSLFCPGASQRTPASEPWYQRRGASKGGRRPPLGICQVQLNVEARSRLAGLAGVGSVGHTGWFASARPAVAHISICRPARNPWTRFPRSDCGQRVGLGLAAPF